jgi:hypothetical protein
MIIDGVNINVYGLILLKATGFLDFPKRKDILDVQKFTTNDAKYDSAKGTIVLFGDWATPAELEIGLNNLQALINSSVKHTIELDEYNLPAFSEATFKDGYKVQVIRTVAEITMKITVANSKWVAS